MNVNATLTPAREITLAGANGAKLEIKRNGTLQLVNAGGGGEMKAAATKANIMKLGAKAGVPKATLNQAFANATAGAGAGMGAGGMGARMGEDAARRGAENAMGAAKPVAGTVATAPTPPVDGVSHVIANGTQGGSVAIGQDGVVHIAPAAGKSHVTLQGLKGGSVSLGQDGLVHVKTAGAGQHVLIKTANGTSAAIGPDGALHLGGTAKAVSVKAGATMAATAAPAAKTAVAGAAAKTAAAGTIWSGTGWGLGLGLGLGPFGPIALLGLLGASGYGIYKYAKAQQELADEA